MTLPTQTKARKAWNAAVPFPHVVIDGMWHQPHLDAIVGEWPDLNDVRWKRYDDGEHEHGKREGSDPSLWGPHATRLIERLHSPEWIAYLEQVTGRSGLTADTWGGGLHAIVPGGWLHRHVDFNVHPTTGRKRVLNLLVYLNQDPGEPVRGGELELRKNDGGIVGALGYQPTMNRTVIFDCTEGNLHGHPEPWRGEHPRRSIAVYYYVDEEVGAAHSTVWDDDEAPHGLILSD